MKPPACKTIASLKKAPIESIGETVTSIAIYNLVAQSATAGEFRGRPLISRKSNRHTFTSTVSVRFPSVKCLTSVLNSSCPEMLDCGEFHLVLESNSNPRRHFAEKPPRHNSSLTQKVMLI